MNFFARLLGARAPAAPPNAAAPPGTSPSQAASRSELLRVVLRDTLTHNGIPMAWLGAEALPVTLRGREPGVHLRLLVKHWDPRLLTSTMAFQHSFLERLALFDAQAQDWLGGISWQLALPEAAAYPPMPAKTEWANPEVAAPALPDAGPGPGSDKDTDLKDRKAELNRLLAESDARHKGESPTKGKPTHDLNFEATQPLPRENFDATQPMPRPDFEATQKMFLPTEPGKLEN